jgi:hypothetical protein
MLIMLYFRYSPFLSESSVRFTFCIVQIMSIHYALVYFFKVAFRPIQYIHLSDAFVVYSGLLEGNAF